MSDTHLGRGDNDEAARRWTRTAARLRDAKGDFVLHLGDVVDGGREDQYAVYKETRATIGKPVYEIPGNHDPQPLFEKHLRQPVELAFDHQGVRFLLLNNSRTEEHHGFISEEQISWLDREISDAEKRQLGVILAMHVPLHENMHPDRGWYVQPGHGQAELRKLLAHHRERVWALFHGHFHNGIRGWDDYGTLPEVVFPSALYNQDRKLAEQKAPGFYLPELRPGYVQVTLSQAGLTLRYEPVLDSGSDPTEMIRTIPQLKAD